MEIINLDMTPSTVTPNAHAGQYDSARTVRFMLKNGGVPFTLAGTEIITAEITRSDNTEVTVNVANTSSNYVDVVFDDTVCTVKGLYACELRLKDSDGFDIGSKNFALLVQRDPYDGAGVRIVTVGPADICTFETTLPEPLQSVIVDIEATGGNGTPDNPNPINGFTEAKITRCGVNLWDEEWEIGSIDPTGATYNDPSRIRSKNYCQIKGDIEVYTIDPTNNYNIRLFFYDANKNFISPSGWLGKQTTTTPEGACYFKFIMGGAYGTTYNHDISILYPSSEHNYRPYNGQTYTIAFGQTVYGGVLDVTRRKLTVTFSNVDLGSLSWNSTTNFFYANLPQNSVENTPNYICTKYDKPNNLNGLTLVNGTEDKVISIAGSAISHALNRVYIRDTAYTDAATFKTAMNGVYLVYPLATPFDIDLTPVQIEALLGVNNVFADCGKTEVKYLKAGA